MMSSALACHFQKSAFSFDEWRTKRSRLEYSCNSGKKVNVGWCFSSLGSRTMYSSCAASELRRSSTPVSGWNWVNFQSFGSLSPSGWIEPSNQFLWPQTGLLDSSLMRPHRHLMQGDRLRKGKSFRDSSYSYLRTLDFH